MSVTIFNTIRKAGGLGQDDFHVVVELMWDTSVLPVAKSLSESVMFRGTLSTNTNSSGYWAEEVSPNDDIEPAGSVYKITETEKGGTAVLNEYYISVPTSQLATPVTEYWVGDLIVATPSWIEED